MGVHLHGNGAQGLLWGFGAYGACEAYGAYGGCGEVESVAMATRPMGAEAKWGRHHGNEAYGAYRAYGG